MDRNRVKSSSAHIDTVLAKLGVSRRSRPDADMPASRQLDGLCEASRTRLIDQITVALQGDVPPDARAAGLTLIGWLARRMPGEPPDSHRAGSRYRR
jgi:hypothetical protein